MKNLILEAQELGKYILNNINEIPSPTTRFEKIKNTLREIETDDGYDTALITTGYVVTTYRVGNLYIDYVRWTERCPQLGTRIITEAHLVDSLTDVWTWQVYAVSDDTRVIVTRGDFHNCDEMCDRGEPLNNYDIDEYLANSRAGAELKKFIKF